MLQFAEPQSPKNLASVRPALFIDNRAVERHSPFLGHFFTALADQSYRAALVCEQDCQDDVILSPAVEVIVHKPSRLPFIRSQNRQHLLNQVRKFRPTVLHCMSHTKARLTRYVAEQLNVPYLLNVYSLERFANDEISNRFCTGIVCPGDTISESMKQQFPFMAQRIWQVNMGVFVDSKTACFTNLNRIPSIVVAHPFERIEHFELLFEALRHLLIERYEFIVMLIGRGKAETRLRQLSKEMGLTGVINFVSDNVLLRNIFLEADIFVELVPNTFFNGAIPEAMSVGMVVAGPSGGVDGLLIENETAVLFDHKNPESIHSTIKMLLDRRDYAQYIAKKAQTYLKRNNTVTSMMDTLIDAYKSAIKP